MTARHAYLGTLEDVEHPLPSYFANGQVVSLPLIILRDIVLFPGEELPLRLLSEASIESLRENLTSDGALLAVMCPGQKEASYGTTVRVERFNLIENTASVTGIAKQRFRLIGVKNAFPRHSLHGEIEILADIQPPCLPFPVSAAYPDLQQASPRRKRAFTRFPSYWGFTEFALFDARQLVRRIQQLMISSVHCTWFRRLTSSGSARVSLVSYLTDEGELPDPVRFAYWIAANLPLDQNERLALLRITSIIELLRQELAILAQLEENVYCSRCGTFLAQTRDIFSMTRDGVAGTFVNPGGFVHQIMTLREVHLARVFVDALRSTEDSWFPGYAWSIVYCNVCRQHLGWEFNRVEEGLQPACFYGFRRAALSQSRQSSAEDNSDLVDAGLWIEYTHSSGSEYESATSGYDDEGGEEQSDQDSDANESESEDSDVFVSEVD
ncbi:hypothetical protein Poli38472_007460 [Pythium oligandrum]|uniref:Protein cereblon n=1 Tax=Pythium oligandrum TaxID=41045 RepID=A0A8K1CRS8_PYTOL|nr:hypothetical protein Poli38472_007460 [Pythium oligandrum]|eukprot:TMW67788.1 hypothetical protein Poli38472_007460 [Pythium oligandrum]